MKRVYSHSLLTSVFVFIHVLLFSQAINTVSVFPSNPTPEDSVKVIANVWLPSGSCWLDNHYALYSQDTLIDVFGTFNSGMLTVICGTSDTFALGRLDAGNYHCRYIMRYLTLPAFADTATLLFTVGSTSGINTPTKPDKKFSICQGSGTSQLQLKYNLSAGEMPLSLSVYTVDGRLVQSFSPLALRTASLFLPSPGNSGLYLYTLKTTDKKLYTCKFLLP
ncbi:MAG: hypothetical protein WCO63_04610 [Bacteroidota bacterium]